MPTVDAMTTSTPVPRRAGIPRQLGIDTQYVLLGLPLGIVALVLTWVGFALGIALAAVVVGLPILAGTMFLARGLASVERSRAGAVLRAPVHRPVYRTARRDASF